MVNILRPSTKAFVSSFPSRSSIVQVISHCSLGFYVQGLRSNTVSYVFCFFGNVPWLCEQTYLNNVLQEAKCFFISSLVEFFFWHGD